MEKFGSLSRPVTITIDGEVGSGKVALAAFISNILESYGAFTDFDIITSNEKIASNKEEFWKESKRFMSNGKITFQDKIVHLVVKE